MSFTEKQQMDLDTESATHARMEAQSRSSHKYVLVQVWCGLLTVALVIMAALLTSIKPKSAEGNVSSQISDLVTTTVDTSLTTSKSIVGSSNAYIQLFKNQHSQSWESEHSCESCSLKFLKGSIHCSQSGLYFLYAQVNFHRHSKKSQTKYVILKRNTSFGISEKKLVEGTFPSTTEGSVWVGKIVRLTGGVSISLNITDDFLTEGTFWGAYQLR